MTRHTACPAAALAVLTGAGTFACADAPRSERDSDPPQTAEAREGDDVSGTLEATIDGERQEFFIVAGDIRGQPYASAAWYEPEGGGILFAIGGLDTPSPPLDTFEQGADGQPVSFGEYDGPVLSMMLELTAEPEPFEALLPDDESMTALVYMSRPSFQDMNAMYLLASGTLDVAEIELSNGLMSARGTFSGTFRSLGSGEEVEITDGTFTVEGAPHLEQITPGSG